MSTDITPENRVDQLLSYSKKFDEIVEGFDDEIDCYYALQDAAKSHLRSFEDLIQFYEICIDQGPAGFIYSRLDRNAERSLKNMILQDSPAGKRFPINSLPELDNRVQSYRDLGLDGITTKSVVSTTLEHIYAKEREVDVDLVYERCDNLLDESDQTIGGKKLLAHARFVSATSSVDRDTEAFDYYTSEFLSDLPDPYPEDQRSADELWERSEDAAYSETKKIKLAQSSLIRQSTELRLAEYLYLDAIDTVERYRHNQREKPKRAELQLCRDQITLLQSKLVEILKEDRNTRLSSYLDVVLGQLNSGNWWSSQQDTDIRPTPKYRNSATHFYSSAQIIKPIDRNRFIKYFGKAMRNAAVAARYENYGPANGWEVCLKLHDMAISVLSNLSEDDDTKINNTVEKSLALHRCLRFRAEAVLACYNGDLQRVRNSVDKAFQVLRTEEVPIYIEKETLKGLKQIAEALEHKEEGAFEEAVNKFNSIDIPEALISTEKPINIEKIKIDLIAEEYDDALDTAENSFNEGNPVRTAVEIIAGKEPHTPRMTEEYTYPIIGIDDASIWSLALVTEFIQQGDLADSEVSDELKQVLLEI